MSTAGDDARSAPRAGELLVATACLFVSGALALAYEICWIRKGSLLLGTTTLALSTVLAAFFGGLALGSYVIGQRSQ